MFVFSCIYVNMTSLVTPRLFFAFTGEYHVFLSDINFIFCMQSAFQINLLPFSIAFIRRYTEMDEHQKMFDVSSSVAATINL